MQKSNENAKVNNKHNVLIEKCDDEEEEDEEMKFYERKEESLEEKDNEDEAECENEHCAVKKRIHVAMLR